MPVRLETGLTVEQCKDRLARSIDPEKFGLWTGYAGSRPIVGRIDDVSFRLQKRRYGSNPSAPFFSGQMVPFENGTRIEGSFQMHGFVKTSMTFYFWFLGISCVAMLISNIAGRTVFQAPMLLVPVGMAVWGAALVKFGQWLGRSEEKAIVEFLKHTCEASDVP